jgi:outer membrane protein assembly factor BamB
MLALTVCGVVLRSLTAAENPEWPQFRGPNSSGIAASDAAPPVEFGPSKRLIWKQALPLGDSSPAVWGDRVFLTAFDSQSKKLELICITPRPARSSGGAWRPPTRSRRRAAAVALTAP